MAGYTFAEIFFMSAALTLDTLNQLPSLSAPLFRIAEKVFAGERIDAAEALLLFEQAEPAYLATLANYFREKRYGHKTFFNRNFHIEPTNVCVFSCAFCSYSRLYKNREEGWELSLEQMLDLVKKYDGLPVTEVHIVGGVHPKLDLAFFCNLLEKIHAHRPDLHLN